MPRPPIRRALCLTLAAGMLAAAAAPAVSATAAELRRAQQRIDHTSAQLAQARTAAERLGGEERAALERIERRLERQKQALLALESGLAATHAEERADRAADDDGDRAITVTPLEAPEPAAADGPSIVLADPPTPRPAATGGVGAPAGIAMAAERSPAVSGAGAVTASAIDGYLASKASPMTGLGAVFVSEAESAGLDPRFLVAISGAETSFGTYGPSQSIHNPFGMGPGIVYPSWSDAIRAAARNLAGDLYAGDGRYTIPAIQQRWAPHGATNDPTGLNSNWTRNVGTYLAELGGDPAASMFTGRAAPPSPVGVAIGTAGLPVVAPLPYSAPVTVLGRSGAGPDAAQEALGRLGAPSVRSGSSPESGFDAAGLVRWAYAQHDVTLPAGARAQARAGTAVAPADLESGDAVLFAGAAGPVDHVGLYLGDGQFVHAPGDGDQVRISSLYEPYYAEAYAGARRY